MIANMNESSRVERIPIQLRGSVPVLVTVFCAFAVISGAAQQVSGTRIGRFGAVGRSLSEREIAQIADLAGVAGKPAWLVLGLPSMIRGVATLTVYLHPDVTTQRLHRGRVLHLVAKDPPVVSERTDWMTKDTASYAYIPLTESSGEIASENDLAWPFAVVGGLDDETLISLVRFVRSRPPIPGVPESQAPREVVSAPLSVVARMGDQFIAAFRTGNAAVFRVWLIRKDGTWLVTKWDAAVA